ncbi:MAG: insulinase family protein [Myxococcales bacterium]|nr:insulinase family protein [Myxococcales bacterium]
MSRAVTRVVGLLALALTLAACGAKPPPPVDRSGLPAPKADPGWAPPAVETWTLANGMEVWFLRQAQAPLLSLQIIFPGGASADPQGKAGLTSLVADMLDEGAAGRTSLQISEDLQRLATDYGASAATDGLVVSMDLLADKLSESLAILKNILRSPDFPAEEFERRKAQRIAAALADEAEPGTAASLTLRRALFGEGYGGMSPGGIRDTLQGLTLADVKAQYAAVVQPAGARIVVVGDADRDAVQQALQATFGDWQGQPSAPLAVVAGAQPPAAIHLVNFPGSTQSVVQVARRIPGTIAADDQLATDVFNWTIGGAFTSRLNLNLREDKGYTYGARSGFNRWRQAGFFSLGARVKADTTRASIDEIQKELADVTGARPVTDQERGEAVGGMLLGFPGDFERMASVAGQLTALVLDGHPSDYLQHWPARMAAVTTADANAMAKKYAHGDFVIVVVGDKAALLPTLESLGLPVIEHDGQGNLLPAAPPTAPPAEPPVQQAAR